MPLLCYEEDQGPEQPSSKVDRGGLPELARVLQSRTDFRHGAAGGFPSLRTRSDLACWGNRKAYPVDLDGGLGIDHPNNGGLLEWLTGDRTTGARTEARYVELWQQL